MAKSKPAKRSPKPKPQKDPNALELKEIAFAEAYLKLFNQTKAAIAAGYSERSARSTGARLMAKANVKAYVRARMAESAMDADEVLYHLGQIGRGDVDDLLNEYGNLDIEKARRLGVTNLIRKVRNRQVTTEHSTSYETETEGYDRMRALELIGKYLAMWTDKLQIDIKQLDELLTLAKAKGVSSSDLFNAMIQQLAEVENEK